MSAKPFASRVILNPRLSSCSVAYFDVASDIYQALIDGKRADIRRAEDAGGVVSYHVETPSTYVDTHVETHV